VRFAPRRGDRRSIARPEGLKALAERAMGPAAHQVRTVSAVQLMRSGRARGRPRPARC